MRYIWQPGFVRSCRSFTLTIYDLFNQGYTWIYSIDNENISRCHFRDFTGASLVVCTEFSSSISTFFLGKTKRFPPSSPPLAVFFDAREVCVAGKLLPKDFFAEGLSKKTEAFVLSAKIGLEMENRFISFDVGIPTFTLRVDTGTGKRDLLVGLGLVFVLEIGLGECVRWRRSGVICTITRLDLF